MAARGNTPPAGGTPWEWLTTGNGSQELVNSINKWADHYGIPRQFVYDLVWRENGTGGNTGNPQLHITTSGAGAVGPMQLVPEVRSYYGINANSSTDDMVFAGISLLYENGTNTGYGHLNNVNGGNPLPAWDPAAAAGMYIAGPAYYAFLRGENPRSFGPISRSYVLEVTRNTLPWGELPQRFLELPIAEFYRPPNTTLGIGSDVNFPLGDLNSISPALLGDPSQGFFLDPTMLRQQPGVLSPNAGSVLQGLGILPLDWGWDPTSNTWQNAPGAGSNWTLEQVPSVAGGFNLQLWDPAGAGIQYRPGGIGSDANIPSGDPFAGNDPWPILQGGGGANVATGGIDLANAAARWFGGVSAPGGTTWDASTGGTFWDASPNAGGGTVWDATPGQSVLRQVWDPTLENAPGAPPGGLTTWDPNLLNQPGAISPGLGGYLQSMNVFSSGMGYNPVDEVWQNAPPAPGWQLMDINQYSSQALPTLQQYFQQLFPTESFTNAFEGIGGFSQPNAVMNWVPPAPQGQQYQAGQGGFGYMGLPPQGTYPTMLPPEGTYGDQPAGATHVIPGIFGSSAVQDYGQPSLSQQIDATTAQANAWAQAQVNAFNQQQAAHNAQAQQNITNPWNGWDLNFVNTGFPIHQPNQWGY